MASPHTLLNQPLQDKDRLKTHIHAFFEGYIWDETDPAIQNLISHGVKSSWYRDPTTPKYILIDYVNDIIEPLRGDEWILHYPHHYLGIDKAMKKVITQQGTKKNGITGYGGSWDDTTKTLFIETTTSNSNPVEGLKFLVHEFSHSKKLGLELATFVYYNHDDWFTPAMKNDDGSTNWDLILDHISDYALTGQVRALKDLPYLDIVRHELATNSHWQKKIKNNETGEWVDIPRSIKDGRIAKSICEEIIVRAASDVSVSNALHDDFDYLFQPGWPDIIFAQEFLEKIKLFCWPRLPENKPTLIDLFKGGSIWD